MKPCVKETCGRKHYAFGLCQKHYLEQRRKTHPPKVSQEDRKSYHFKKKYGITLHEAEQLLERQGGLCAVCGGPVSWALGDKNTSNSAVVDHEPGSKPAKVRGVLHGRCNVALGQLQDSSVVADAAAKYLRSHGR